MLRSVASERSCSVLSGVILGGAVATLLFALEIVSRGAPFEPMSIVLVITLGLGVGGLLGGATAPVRRRPWLALLLLAPPFLLGLPDLWWATERALSLSTTRRPQLMFGAIQGALLITVVAGVAAVSSAALHYVKLRKPLHRALTIAAVSIAGGWAGLLLLERDALHVGTWLVFTWLAAAGATIALSRWVNLAGVPCLLGVGTGMALVPVHYPALSSSLSTLTFAIAVLLVRHNAGSVLTRGAGASRGALALVLASLSLLAAERVTVRFPSAWRVRPAPGALSGALYALAAATDFDDDGASMFFGAHDCAPFDPNRSPARHEILDNGVDDNCLGGSATATSPPFLRAADGMRDRPRARASGRDVVIYVIDALRYDDAMAEEGFASFFDTSVVYERAYSTGTFTTHVMMGHLGGRLPSTTELVWLNAMNGYPSPVPKLLQHHLAEHGYDTGLAGGMACHGEPHCIPEQTAYFLPRSYGRGHRVLELAPRDAPADVVLERARAAWAQLDGDRPRFLWIHDMSVHDAGRDRARYRAKIRAAARTFQTLRRELAPDALWVLTSDHGEEFGEHGGHHHARTLYDEVLRVPLAIHVPDVTPARIESVCSTRSLMPTIIALLGVDVGPPGPGPFLCLAPEGCADQPAPAALEMPSVHLHALVLGRRKIVRDLRRDVLFWFNLERDAAEQAPAYDPPADLRDALVAWEEHAFGNTAADAVWPYTAH